MVARRQPRPPVVRVTEGKPHVYAAYHEVYYVLSGYGHVTLDGHEHPLRPGSVAVIPAGVSHALVDYAAVDSAKVGTFTDLSAFRETVRVTLRGRFRDWRGRVTPFRPPPEPGAEPETRPRETLVLDFTAAEAEAAARLVEALRLLRAPDPGAPRPDPGAGPRGDAPGGPAPARVRSG